MTPDERQSRADWLAALGVPTHFRDAIIDAPNDRGAVVVDLALGAVAVGVWAATAIWLKGHVEAQAVALATQSGASLTYVNVGLGPLLLFFGLIALLSWISAVLAGRYRVNGFLSHAAARLNWPPGPGLTRRAEQWVLSGSVRRAGGRSTTVDEFLRAVAGSQARRRGIAAIVLVLPAIPLTALETNSFWVAGPSGIIEHRMFPPFSSHHYNLSDASVLTTGCIDASSYNRFIYYIEFASGDRFDLGDTRPFKGNKILAIEEIDAKIDRKIEHRRWQSENFLNFDPVDSDCFNYWAGHFDRDGGDRLAKLLRLTADEAPGLLGR